MRRRKYLTLAASGTVFGLAGCLGGEDGGDDDPDDEPADSSGSESGDGSDGSDGSDGDDSADGDDAEGTDGEKEDGDDGAEGTDGEKDGDDTDDTDGDDMDDSTELDEPADVVLVNELDTGFSIDVEAALGDSTVFDDGIEIEANSKQRFEDVVTRTGTYSLAAEAAGISRSGELEITEDTKEVWVHLEEGGDVSVETKEK